MNGKGWIAISLDATPIADAGYWPERRETAICDSNEATIQMCKDTAPLSLIF
jgi:hypothetical protein